MDTEMHPEAVGLPQSRKRSARALDEQSDGDDEDVMVTEDSSVTQTPAKRIRSNQFGPSRSLQQPLKYNARGLLNTLAFTQLYVTANFMHYNPMKSIIILCLTSNGSALYNLLCELLPSLYRLSPCLQALGVKQSYSTERTPSQQQTLPVTDLAAYGGEVLWDFEVFQQALPQAGDCIAVFDTGSTCRWTSHEVTTVSAQPLSDDMDCDEAPMAKALYRIVDQLENEEPQEED